MNNGTIIFDEELYKINIEENDFPDDGSAGLSEEDLKELKENGLI